jgi:hypothetical protein
LCESIGVSIASFNSRINLYYKLSKVCWPVKRRILFLDLVLQFWSTFTLLFEEERNTLICDNQVAKLLKKIVAKLKCDGERE